MPHPRPSAIPASSTPVSTFNRPLPARSGRRPLAIVVLEVAPRILGREWRTESRRLWERSRHHLVHPDQLARDDHPETLREADGHAHRTVLLGLGHRVARKLEDARGHFGQPATELVRRGLRAGGPGERENARQQRNASQRKGARNPPTWM